MMSPEKVTLNTQEINREETMSVIEITKRGDPRELKELDDKYMVSSVSEKTVENTTHNEPLLITNEGLSNTFPGSYIVKKTNGTYFAIRKNKEGEWEGNSFTSNYGNDLSKLYRT